MPLSQVVAAGVVPLPMETSPEPHRPSESPVLRIAFVASFSYFPNVDALDYLLNSIIPSLPTSLDWRLEVVGAEPPVFAKALLHEGRVRLHGYIDDLGTLLTSTDIFVVPLRFGGGVKLKTMTALARGIPVVTTQAGCTGLSMQDGEHLLIRDTPAGFVEALRTLAANASLRQKLGDAGRGLIARAHAPSVVTKALEMEYEAAMKVAITSVTEWVPDPFVCGSQVAKLSIRLRGWPSPSTTRTLRGSVARRAVTCRTNPNGRFAGRKAEATLAVNAEMPSGGFAANVLLRAIAWRLRGSVRLTHTLARIVRRLQAVPVEIDGATVFLDLRSTFCTDLILGARPEPLERGLMRKLVRRGEVALDVGAHFGLHTALLSRLVGPAGDVYAFEPSPVVLPCLTKTIGRFSNTTLLPVALGKASVGPPLLCRRIQVARVCRLVSLA